MPLPSEKTWAVAEAKARLSEVLRLARVQGPQRVGNQQPCYILSEADYLALKQAEPSLGVWLVEKFSGVGEVPLPNRAGPERPVPFGEEPV